MDVLDRCGDCKFLERMYDIHENGYDTICTKLKMMVQPYDDCHLRCDACVYCKAVGCGMDVCLVCTDTNEGVFSKVSADGRCERWER